jgi:hypothetical protein
MKVSENFSLVEFIPQSVWNQFHESGLWFIDPRLITSVQWLRKMLKVPLVINNWHSGGTFQNRGFRPKSSPVWKEFSQHSFGRALDLSSPDMPHKDVYKWVLDNQDLILANTAFTTVEDIEAAPTWLHLDIRQRPNAKELLIVKP